MQIVYPEHSTMDLKDILDREVGNEIYSSLPFKREHLLHKLYKIGYHSIWFILFGFLSSFIGFSSYYVFMGWYADGVSSGRFGWYQKLIVGISIPFFSFMFAILISVMIIEKVKPKRMPIPANLTVQYNKYVAVNSNCLALRRFHLLFQIIDSLKKVPAGELAAGDFSVREDTLIFKYKQDGYSNELSFLLGLDNIEKVCQPNLIDFSTLDEEIFSLIEENSKLSLGQA